MKHLAEIKKEKIMKLSYAWMIGCAGTALLLAGCGPKIAETPLGAEDQQWQQTIQASYPGWQPPRVAAPAVKGNLDENFVNPAAAPAADSGEPVVESAEPAVSAAAVETTGVPAASADAEVVVVAPAEETKAPEAAPAPEAKAETAKAAPAAEAKAETAEAASAEKYEEYVVVKGDSLSKIAKKFYKDGNRFPVLIKANEDLLKGNPNRLRVGMKLRIPAL